MSTRLEQRVEKLEGASGNGEEVSIIICGVEPVSMQITGRIRLLPGVGFADVYDESNQIANHNG